MMLFNLFCSQKTKLYGLLLCVVIAGNTLRAQKLLDAGELTGASTAAWSIRQLKTVYSHAAITPPATVSGFTNSSTPLIRVRRTAAPTGELDIGYLASGELDTVTLKNFCGSGNGFISVWYDQSGNSRDVRQATTANQPRIVNAGTIERSTNGKIGIRFVRDGGNTYAGSNSLTLTISPSSLFNSGITGTAASVLEASSGNASAWGFGNGSNRWQVFANEGGSLKFDYGDSYQRAAIPNTANQGLLKNYMFTASLSEIAKVYVNGVYVANGSTASGSCTATTFEIGGIASFNNWNFDNRQSELILFNSVINANDRAKVFLSQGEYFQDMYIWTGATNSNFNVATNWKNNAVPPLNSHVYVPVTTRALVIDHIYQVHNLSVEVDAQITMSGSFGELRVSGDITLGATFSSLNNITLNGSATQNVTGPFGGFGNLTIDNANGVNMPAGALIFGFLTFSSGYLNLANTTTNPSYSSTLQVFRGIVGCNATNHFRSNNQSRFIWGGTEPSTIFFQSANNDLEYITLTNIGALTLGSDVDIAPGPGGSNGYVSISSGATLDIGTFNLNRTAAGGTLTVTGTLRIGGASNFPANFSNLDMAGGTVEYNGLNTITQTVSTLTYNNLTLTNGSGTGDAPKASAGNFSVNGTFSVGANTTFTPAAANIISGSGLLTGTGTVVANRTAATADFNTQYPIANKTLTGLTVHYNSSLAQTVNNTHTYGNIMFSNPGGKTLGGSIDVNGNLTINSGTLAAGGNQINIAGNWILTSGTFSQGTGTVVFDGTTQTIGGATATTFNGLVISSSVSTTLQGNISFSNATPSSLTISAGSIFNLGTFTANSASASSALTINGTLQLGAATGGQTGSNYPSGFATPTMGTNSTVEYNAPFDVTQTVYAITYRNLILTNGTGSGNAIKNATANFTVQNTFTVNAGAIFSPNTAVLVVNGTGATLTGNGAIIRRAALTTQYPSFTINSPPLTIIDGTVTNYAAGTYSNIFIVVNTTLSGNIIVTGDLLIINGTLTTNNNNINIAGNWDNDGTYAGGTSVVTFNGTNQTISGATATTFHQLVISSGTTTLLRNTNIANVAGASLTINSGATLDLQTFSLNALGGTRTLTVNGRLRLGGSNGGQPGSNYPTNFTAPPTMGADGIIEYSGSNAISQTVFATTYNNLLLTNGSGSGNAAKISTASFVVNTGTFRIDTLCTFTPAAANVISGTGTIRGTGTIAVTRTAATTDLNTQYSISTKTLDSLTVNYSVNAAYSINAHTYGSLIISGGGIKILAGAIAVNRDLTISAGTLASGGFDITLRGNYINNATRSGTGTVVFAGTSQSISGTTNPSTFNSITINSGSTVTASQNIRPDADVNINAGGELNLNTFTGNRNTAGGTLTVAGTLRLNATTGGQTGSNFPTNFTTITPTGGTVVYGLVSGGQTIFATTYNNLTLGNTSGNTQTAGAALTVNGTLSMNGGILNMGTNQLSGASLTTSGTGTIRTQNTGATPIPEGRTWSQTVLYDASGAQTIVNGNYQDLNVSGGNRTLSSTGTIAIAQTFTTGTGTFTITGSTVNFNGIGVQTIPALSYNNLQISGTRVGSPSVTLFPATINILGNFTNTSTGIGTFVVDGSTVNYNGAAQDVAAITYDKLVISGTGLKTLTGNTIVDDSITVSGTAGLNGAGFTLTARGAWVNLQTFAGASGTVIMEGYSAQTISGTVVPTFNNFTINNSNNVNMDLSMEVSGTLTFTAGKLVLNGQVLTTGGPIINTVSEGIRGSNTSILVINNTTDRVFSMDQTTPGTTNMLRILTLNNTSGTATSAGNIVIADILTIIAGATLDLGTNTLSGSITTLTNNGTIRTQNTGSNPIPSGRSWGGMVSYDATTGGQTIVPATSYNTLRLGNTSGTQTANAAINASSIFITSANSTLNMGTNTLSASSISNLGTIRTQNTGSTPIPSGRTFNGTVIYDAATGGQTIRANTYLRLRLNNTSGNQTAQGNLVVNDSLTTTAGGTLLLAGNTLSGSLNTITNNGTISTTNTSATPFTSGKTWGGTGRVLYAAATGGQTVVSGTYNCDLELSNTTGNTNTLGGNVTCGRGFTLATGNLTLGSNTLTLNGAFTNTSARFIGSTTSNLTIGGTGAFGSNILFDQSVPNASNRLNNFVLNRASTTIALGDSLRIGGTFSPNAGTLTTNSRLIIASDANGTGRIAAVTASISGNIIAERFIPSATSRRWRFLSSPVSGRTLADWKTIIHITGSGGAANGFDPTLSNQAGVYRYQEDTITGNLNSGWTPAASITDAIQVGRGYRVFVRGDRNPGRLDGSIASQNEITLRLTGTLNSGNITLPVTITSSGNIANDGWNLVGNPYPSPYDWNAHYDAGGANVTNIGSTIHIYDPKTNSYSSFNAASDINVGKMFAGVIPSGSAFWVKVPAYNPTPSLVLTESRKVASPDSTRLFKTDFSDVVIRVTANQENQDEIVIRYDNSASVLADEKDIVKMFGGGVQLASITPNQEFLAANVKPLNGTADSIPLSIGSTFNGTHTFTFSGTNKLPSGMSMYLRDQYTQSLTPIREGSVYAFEVDAAKESSKGTDRFMLITQSNYTSAPEAPDAPKGFTLFPSMTSGPVTIRKQGIPANSGRITITDIKGTEVVHIPQIDWNQDTFQLHLQDYPNGIYLITIQSDEGNKTFKCVKY